ncbi:AAA family ATPase, partial [Aquaspirillum serpens]|uniref:AAA family ATPase n=1 Tax=Aquaspirillum serpens TaxID=190 RepID=UPI00058BA72D
MRKKLPIGIQTFAKIREDNHYYIDKTPMAYQLAMQGSHYFLSRPRRFGKSLFLDTLAELWAGNESLFQGLWIHDKWDWSQSYPVIRISFGGGVMRSPEALQERIQHILHSEAERFGLSYRTPSVVDRFIDLIQYAHQKSGQRVVVLVDEYDKPILDNLT